MSIRCPTGPATAFARCAGFFPLLAIFAACGGGGTVSPPPPPPPPPPGPPAGSITVLASTGNATIQQGSSASITVIVNRQGSFTGPVTIAVENLPTGVTAAQSNVTTGGTSTSATITFTVTTSAAPGTTSLTIRVSGSGVTDATTAFSLTVTAAPAAAYTLAITGAPLTIEQGTNGQAAVVIARTGGFAGNVTLAIEGAPAGLAVSVTPSPTGGDQATIIVIASAGLAAGTYNLTLRGTAAALNDRTVPFAVTVTPVTATGNVTLDFSGCGSPYAIWVAYKDGNGPWTRVPGTGLFQFTISSPTAAYAYVVRQSAGGAATVNVQYQTRAEMSKAPVVFCPLIPFGVKFINGSVAGLTGSQAVFMAMGKGIAIASAPFPTFQIPLVQDGPRDLVAYRMGGIPGATDRVIVRRDLNMPTGTTLAPLDFGASEAAVVATATLNVVGLIPSEGVLEEMGYLVRATCDGGMMWQTVPITATHPISGVPAAIQRPTDFHLLRVNAATANTSRFVEESFNLLANRTMTLGDRLGNPQVAVLPGGYKRLEAVVGVPLEYNAEVRLNYLQTSGGGAPRLVELRASPGWIASTTATLTMPDFTGVTGWLDTFGPAAAATSRWTITATGGDATGSRCREGSRLIRATATGNN